jgi:hypothetical protein
MSTILKALRRLEEQKSAATQRPLRDEVVLAPGRKSRRGGLVVAIAAAIAFALVGAALVALFDRVPEADPRSAQVPIAEPDVAAPPAADSGVAVADDETVTEVTVASPEAKQRGIQVPPVVPIPAAEPDFEIVRPESKPRPFIPSMQVDPMPARDDAGSARPNAAPQRVAEPNFVEEGVVQEEADAAPATGGGVSVHVARTQWHPSPDRRIAWIEVDGAAAPREVHEGERIGSYVVREIQPAAVLFSEGGVSLRREVGR